MNETEQLRAELERVKKQLDAANRREKAYRSALRPFADCDPSPIGSIPSEKTFLWKPSQTSKELNGISIAHINAAKAALQPDAGKEQR